MEKKNWAIVDDDLIFHLVTQRLIESKDIHKKLFFFRNGKEAIDFVKSHQSDPKELPDIILLDIKMPVMDGWDFMDQYLSMENDLPKNIIIYIVSSSIDKMDTERAEQISAIKEYIVKPIDQKKLDDIIDELKAA